jgi:parvulin-like peptidyl-prolyl isomerase
MTVAALERIRNGDASFEQVASEISAASPEYGGDIGWLHKDSIAPWMIDLLKPMQPGDISKVEELPFGCTVLELLERQEHIPVAYETAKDRLANEIFEKKLAQEYRTWIEELRAESFIRRRGYFADAADLRGTSAGVGDPSSEQTRLP